MHARIKIAAVVVVLLCTVATLELPELLKLTDDTSNDFSLTIARKIDVPTVTQQATAPAKTPAGPELRYHQPSRETPRYSFCPSTDLLIRFCIDRT